MNMRSFVNGISEKKEMKGEDDPCERQPDAVRAPEPPRHYGYHARNEKKKQNPLDSNIYVQFLILLLSFYDG